MGESEGLSVVACEGESLLIMSRPAVGTLLDLVQLLRRSAAYLASSSEHGPVSKPLKIGFFGDATIFFCSMKDLKPFPDDRIKVRGSTTSLAFRMFRPACNR